MIKQFSTKFFICLILVVGFLVYVNSLPNGFVWDDEEQIVNNLIIRSWSNLPLVFTSSTFYAGGAGLSGGFYRPLVSLSYMANYQLWGLNPLGFRLFQICLHLLNSILVFFIFRKIFLRQKIKYRYEISALSALFWAIHPANVESVVYLASIGEVLYTFFGLLSFWFFLKYVPCQFSDSGELINSGELTNNSDNAFWPVVRKALGEIVEKIRKNKHLLLGFLFVFIALFAKEPAVVFFPLIALYFFIFIKPGFQFWLKYTFGTAISLGLYSFLRFFVARIPVVSMHLAPISSASFWERLTTIPYEIVSYLRIIFFPKDLAIYQHFVVSSISDILFWGCLIFLSIIFSFIIGFGIWNWNRKSKLRAFFLLWFFGFLFPALNIFPLEMTIAERWLYLPMVSMMGLVGFLAAQFVLKLQKKWRFVFGLFLIFVLFGLSIRTILRNTNWKNGLTLYGHDIKYSRNAFDLENNYGVELFREGRIDEADERFKKSIELQPKWSVSHNNLGAVLERKGNLEKALSEYRKSIEISDYYLAYENIGGILIKMERFGEVKEFLSKALLKFPQNANLKWQLALVYLNESDAPKAISLLLKALEDDPQNLKARQLLETIWINQK